MAISMKLLELESLRLIMAVLFGSPLLLLLLVVLHCLLQLRDLPLQITELFLIFLLLRRYLDFNFCCLRF